MKLSARVPALVAGAALSLCALGGVPAGGKAWGQDLTRLIETKHPGYEKYRAIGFNKAFAVNREGRWAYESHSEKPLADIIENTLNRCNEGAKSPCVVVSVNDVDTRGIDTASIKPFDATAKPVGPLTPAPYYPVRGPQEAKGIVIWSHGVQPGADNTKAAPHGHINQMRDAGFDIYRFDRRHPQYDADIETLIGAVMLARKVGYRKVIVAGQSVGAWMSLEAAAKGAQVDGVVAAAPARFGKEIGSARRERNRDDLLPVLAALRQRDLPVVLMFFKGDDYDPGGRSAKARDIFYTANTKAKVLLIDGPPGIEGHGAGGSGKFVSEYGPCMRDFILAGSREKPCGGLTAGD